MSGPEAKILAIGALLSGVYFVSMSVKNLFGPKRQSPRGEPVDPETGLKLLAQQYQEQGKTEEFLRTLLELHKLRKDYEQLENVHRQLKEFEKNKHSKNA